MRFQVADRRAAVEVRGGPPKVRQGQVRDDWHAIGAVLTAVGAHVVIAVRVVKSVRQFTFAERALPDAALNHKAWDYFVAAAQLQAKVNLCRCISIKDNQGRVGAKPHVRAGGFAVPGANGAAAL